MTRNYSVLGRLALLSTALIWGTSFVILKSAINSISTMWVLAIRFIISAVIMLVIAGKRLKKMDRSTVKGSVLMGLCLAIAYIVQTYGLLFTTPGKNAFLTATYCVLVPFMAWGIYKRKPGSSNIIAALLCIVGIGFVSLSTGFDGLNIGDVLTLFHDADSVSVAAVEFTAAAVLCLVGALLFEPFPREIPQDAYFALFYLSIMCTAVCFFLQAWGMRYTPSSTAAVIMTLEAVFGVIFSLMLGQEQLTARLGFGFVLIFVSVLTSELGEELTKKFKKS